MKFFLRMSKKGKKNVPSFPPPKVRKVGGRVDDIVVSLLKAGNDESANVRSQVFRSLRKIGEDQTDLVLTTAINFAVKTGCQVS